MTHTDPSTALTRTGNRPTEQSLIEQALSEMGVTEKGTLTPEKWKRLHTGFLYMAAIGDYAAEMCKAMAKRARELAEEVDVAASNSEADTIGSEEQ